MYQGQVWARGDFLDRIQSDFDVFMGKSLKILRKYPKMWYELNLSLGI